MIHQAAQMCSRRLLHSMPSTGNCFGRAETKTFGCVGAAMQLELNEFADLAWGEFSQQKLGLQVTDEALQRR